MDEPNAVAGLVAIYFHVLRQRTDAGFSDWNLRVREIEAELGDQLQVLPRISSVQRATADLVDSTLRVHAAAALLQGIWLTRERESDRSVFEAAYENLQLGMGQMVPELVRSATNADEALALGYRMSSPWQFRFELLTAEIDSLNVTRFKARVARTARPGERASELSVEADPENWSLTQPNTFEESFQTSEASPADPISSRPPRVSNHTPGSSWRGQLFEHAVFQLLPGVEITAFRNTLNIGFDVDSKADRVALDYSLYESLSNSMLGSARAPGGLDVDSGSSRISVEGDDLVLVASKNFRVTPAASLYRELNLMSLPVLVCWLSVWLIAAAMKGQ